MGGFGIVIGLGWLVLAVLAGYGEINPAYYLWVDYGAKVDIQMNSNGQYQAKIPCEARIGSCRYNYLSLPPGWQKSSTGSLLLPPESATKSGSYAVKVQLSEQTGQKMTADLVVSISNRVLTVMDAVDYYKKMGVDYKNAQGSKYETSVLVKDVPDGFLSLKEVEGRLSTGTPEQIRSLVKQITQKYAPCRSRINYLTSIKQIFTKLQTSNTDLLTKHKTQTLQLQQYLQKLQQERKSLLTKKGIDQEVGQLDARIKVANNDFIALKSEQFKYEGLAKWAWKKFNGEVEEQEDIANRQTLKKMQEIQAKFNRWLAQAIQDRATLKKGILDIQLLKQTKTFPNKPEVRQVEQSYKQKIWPMIQNEARQIQNQIKITDLQQEQQQNQNFLNYVQTKLTEAASSSQSTADLENQNRLINAELASLQKMIDGASKCG